MFGHRHRDESRDIEGGTSILWVASSCKPTFEGCSPESEGRAREKGAVMRASRLMTGAREGTEPGL